MLVLIKPSTWHEADRGFRSYDRQPKTGGPSLFLSMAQSISSKAAKPSVNQYSIHVEHYVKTAANQWLLSAEYKDQQVLKDGHKSSLLNVMNQGLTEPHRADSVLPFLSPDR